MAYRLSLTALAVATAMVSGCSSMGERNIDVPHTDKNASYFGRGYATNIVNNIDSIQRQRTDAAWEKGVSLSEKLIAQSKGVDPYVGWSPKVQHPAIEEHTKEKWHDVIELSLLFDGEPVEVLANDDITLVTMPQDWLWTFSNREINANADQYLNKMFGLFDVSQTRISIYSQESFKDANFGKEWVSEAKANRFRDYLINNHHIPPSRIQAFGLGAKIAAKPKFSEGDIVQIAIRYNYDVDSSEYVALGD